MEDSVVEPLSFYTQRLRRPRGIVRVRGGAHLHLRTRAACSLFSTVSRRPREQSVTL